MKTQKQTGYHVKIEAFVPADLTDTKMLTTLQGKIDEVKNTLAYVDVATLTPTRR